MSYSCVKELDNKEVKDAILELSNAIEQYNSKYLGSKDEESKIETNLGMVNSKKFKTKYSNIEKLRFVANLKRDILKYLEIVSESTHNVKDKCINLVEIIEKNNLSGTEYERYAEHNFEMIFGFIDKCGRKMFTIYSKLDKIINKYKHLDPSITEDEYVSKKIMYKPF